MAFETQVRLITAADSEFAIQAASTARAQWGAETLASYMAATGFVGTIGLARWPEQGVSNFIRASICTGVRRGTDLWVGLIAIDPAILAETNISQRRILMDRTLRQSLELAVAVGMTTGKGKRVPRGTPQHAYLSGITVAAPVANGEETSDNWTGDLASVISFLQTRSG